MDVTEKNILGGNTVGGAGANRALKTAGPKAMMNDARRLSSYTTRKQGSGFQGSSHDVRSF